MSFAEYAALARHLSDLHRGGERTAARLAEQRGSAGVGADRLEQRLAAQHHRLLSLGQAIGRPVPPVGPPGSAPPPPPAQPSAPTQEFDYPPPTGYVPRQPGRPGVGGPAAPGTTYSELPGGPARRALPTTPVTGADTVGTVPGQRGPVDPVAPGQPGDVTPARPVDPHEELDRARQSADGADTIIVQVETMAQQPPLLPSLSPGQRALAVYGSCAGLLAVVIWIILGVVEIRSATSSFSKAANAVGVFTWSCAGLPTMAFFLGYLALTIWGKPRIVAGTPPRYARLGFLICFLASPVAFLLYYAFN